MKFVVTGASGFLGRNVVNLLDTRGHEVIQLYGRNQVDGGVQLDLLDFAAVERFIDSQKNVNVLVHAAACCNVADVSADPERARRVNVDASINLGTLCSSRGIHFIFISTNYVFDGKTPPYAPNSPTGPVNDYGRQKVDTEQALAKLNNVSVLRIPLQYGNHYNLKPSSRAILDAVRKAREEVIEVDNDQIRTPTYVMNTAHVIEQIGINKLAGTFNYCDGLQVTRFHFAEMVAEALGLGKINIQPATIVPTVIRPKNCFMIDETLEAYKPNVNVLQQIREAWLQKL